MMFTRRILTAGTALALVLTACGGSDDETTETVVIIRGPARVLGGVHREHRHRECSEAATSAAPAEAAPPADVSGRHRSGRRPLRPRPVTPFRSTDGRRSVAPADGVVGLAHVEWAIEAPPLNTPPARSPSRPPTTASFPHELVVIQGESYESLPLAEGGAVIEDDLPTGALLGRTARIGGGSSEELTVALAPGNYVLVCNLGGGAQNHAGRGQRLDIKVS